MKSTLPTPAPVPGTTNQDAPFQDGERVEYCGHTGTVVSNHGTSGDVRVDGEGTFKWYWQAYGEWVRRLPGLLPTIC